MEEMFSSLTYWIGAEYKRQYKRIAEDAPAPSQGYSPAELSSSNPPASVYASIKQRFDAQERRWAKKNAEKAEGLADRFTDRFGKETASGINKNFKRLGLTTTVKNTREAQSMLKLQRMKNTAAIETMMSKYLKSAIALALNDLLNRAPPEDMLKHLKDKAKKAEREAKNTASNIACNTVQTVSAQHYKDLDLNKAVWIHVPGFWYSRRTHEKMHGKEFDVREGLYDSDVGYKVTPGMLFWCRCTCRLVIPDWLK